MADQKKASTSGRRPIVHRPGSGSGTRRGGRGAVSRKRRIFRGIGIAVALALIITIIGGFIFYQMVKLPNPSTDFSAQTTSVYYRDGTTKIGDFSVQNRTVVDYSKMSDSIKAAAVAAEDRSFWTNRGISPRGMLRSIINIAKGGDLQSGSTITQQYIKVRYLNSEQTITRKATELALALKVANQVPKEQVLAGYLNTVYFGRGAYGIEQASQSYFGIPASNLNISQAAMLAAIINSPSALDPANGDSAKKQLTDRYNYVLDGMLDSGSITQADHDANYNKLPAYQSPTQSNDYSGANGFLLQMVESELKNAGLSEDQINGGGLKIVTTFDANMQKAAVQVATDNTNQAIAKAKTKQDPATLHPAIASIGVGTGEVYAMYGGPDYLQSQLNWATTARPAASTFKAWALVAGLRNGYTLNTTLNGNTFTPKGDNVVVHNDSNVNYGTVTLKKATSYSMNTAFTDLEQRMPSGPADTVKAANDAGVPTGADWDENNRIALGTAQVSPVDNATGFATLANDGQRNTTHVVKQVQNTNGQTIYSGNTGTAQAIDTQTAQTAQTALESVVTSGTGTYALKLGRQVIAKTGTKDMGEGGTSAAWFVGATKQISTAVMFVAGSGSDDLDPYAPYGSFESSSYPAYVWEQYMEQASTGLPKLTFQQTPSSAPAPTSTYQYTPRAAATTSAPAQQQQAGGQAPAAAEPTEVKTTDKAARPTSTNR